jgi:hypothetical protein
MLFSNVGASFHLLPLVYRHILLVCKMIAHTMTIVIAQNKPRLRIKKKRGTLNISNTIQVRTRAVAEGLNPRMWTQNTMEPFVGIHQTPQQSKI